MSVVIITENNSLKVKTPYHPDFSTHAKNLGGRGKKISGVWYWYFDIRDEDSLRDLCLDLFGEDGITKPALVDVQVRLEGNDGNYIWFGGREIVKRFGRDTPIKLGYNTVLKDGEFPSRGGSAKYPQIFNNYTDWVLLEVRNVPVLLAQKEKKNDPDNVKILSKIIPVVTIKLLESDLEAMRKVHQDLTDAQLITKALKYFVKHAD